jgi:hypothetical protein
VCTAVGAVAVAAAASCRHVSVCLCDSSAWHDASAASIKDIYHERAWLETSISLVRVKFIVEVSSRQQGIDLIRELRRSGYGVENVSSHYDSYAADAEREIDDGTAA